MRRAFPARSTTAAPPRTGPVGSRCAQPMLPTGCPGQRRDQDGSRVHCDSLDEGGARLGPCGLTTATPQHFTVVSRPVAEADPGVPNTKRNGLRRTALGPYPPGWRRSRFERRKRRFLAYSFPSRSPDPHHLAVLAHSDIVGAACHRHRHRPDQAAPSSTVLLRQNRRRRSPTSSRINSASRRTRRQLNTDQCAATAGQFWAAVDR
jgi:hypothetical protein